MSKTGAKASHRLSAGSAGSPPRGAMQDHTLSWTDDLPVCHLSGVGFATNQIYREDGFRQEEHEFEDRSIHFSLEDNIYLYGVFDGHDSSRVSHFAAQRMPAELLLGQLQENADDDAIKEILRQAFISVEKGYFDSIDDVLAERANLLLQVPEHLEDHEAYRQYPDLYKQVEALETEIAGGTTAVVALIFNNKLYIANAGCSRALLCLTDNEGVLRVFQLSVDHNLDNDEELQRLERLGLDRGKIRLVGVVDNHTHLRTLGDYHIKREYKDIDILSSARSEPVIAEPDVTGGIPINDHSGFLILMSYGMYKSLEDASGTEHVNADIASMVAAEFAQQSTLNGVAQAVVDKLVRIHHDTFMISTDHRKQLCQKRKDITLLIRNFNYPLPNAINSPSVTPGSANPLGLAQQENKNLEQPLSVIIPVAMSSPTVNQPFLISNTQRTTTSTYTSTYASSNGSTQSGDEAPLFQRRPRVSNTLKLDSDGRIEPYVDFSDFYSAIEEMTETQKEAFYAEAEPKPAYEVIPEEKEPNPEVKDQDQSNC